MGFAGLSDVGTIRTTNGSFSNINDIVEMNSIELFDIARDFVGEMQVSMPLASSGLIRIDENLQSSSTIGLPANGLVGQIIINASDTAGTWDGDITVGNTTLAPNYPNTADSLGGGAAGLVPFDLHGEDSWPLDGGSVDLAGDATNAPSPNNAITVRHYGPVRFDGTGSPITVKGRIGDETNFRDLTCFFDVQVSPSDDNVLIVTPDYILPNGSEWEITPKTTGSDRLISSVNGDPSDPSVNAYTHTFCVGTGAGIEACEADIDGDGCVTFNDLVEVLFLFRDKPTCVQNMVEITGQPAGDVNDDGDVDFNDQVTKLFLFGTACAPCDDPGNIPTCGGASSASFTEPQTLPAYCDEILSQLGFISFKSYLQHVETLTLEEQYDEAVLLVATTTDVMTEE